MHLIDKMKCEEFISSEPYIYSKFVYKNAYFLSYPINLAKQNFIFSVYFSSLDNYFYEELDELFYNQGELETRSLVFSIENIDEIAIKLLIDDINYYKFQVQNTVYELNNYKQAP